MTTMGETNQKKQDNRINIESYPQETLLADTIEKRIYLRMADLNLQVETFPAMLKRRMVFTRGTDGWKATFNEGCFGLDHSLMAFPVYLCSLFLKTNPSMFYSDKQNRFDDLTPDIEFVPMEETLINSFYEKYMSVSAISKRLRKIRRENNLTTEEIAKALGVKQPSIVNYEKPDGRKSFRLTTKQLLTFCELCNVSPDLIMLGESFDSIIKRTDENMEQEQIELGPEVGIVYNADNRLHRAYSRAREKKASVEEILQSRQWIIDNIGKVEPDVMFMIKRIINREMLKTSVMDPDKDKDNE